MTQAQRDSTLTLPPARAPKARNRLAREKPRRLMVSLASSIVLGLASLTAAAETVAEATKTANWYQIELVVFTQPQQNLQAEYWQEQRQPTYTKNAIQLRPSAGFGPEYFRNPMPVAESEEQNTNPADPASALLPVDAQANPYTLQPRQLPSPLRQEYSDNAFTLLTRTQQSPQTELDKPLLPINTSRLERRGHRILFQGRWRQPVHEKQQARSIVIRGGQALEPDHFELEGDIQLSLSRYIHLRPNLYLSLALPPEWQPRHPRAIEAQASELSPLADTAPEPEYGSEFDRELTPTTYPVPEGFAALANPLAEPSAEPIAEPITEPLPPQTRYLTLALDQPRRMRRNKLHYLDHPLFGVLIRFTAYTPEPEVIAPPPESAPSLNPTRVQTDTEQQP
ncbi:MAG: CsiV family protein [Motiliproteus sp.]